MIVHRGWGWQARVFMNSNELIARANDSPLFELARVLVRLNRVARFIVDADRRIM
jgi:hypothetical protein